MPRWSKLQLLRDRVNSIDGLVAARRHCLPTPRRRLGRSGHADLPCRPRRARQHRHRPCAVLVARGQAARPSRGSEREPRNARNASQALPDCGVAPVAHEMKRGRHFLSAWGWTVFRIPTGRTVFETPSTLGYPRAVRCESCGSDQMNCQEGALLPPPARRGRPRTGPEWSAGSREAEAGR